ncbi:MAG: SCP2 sterol-binding domain-containing protein, partial [Solirubrobacteraceae bacterium]
MAEEQQVPDIDAEQYAALVADASDEDLERGLIENRELLLEQIFQRMPERFQPDKAGDLDAVVEWRIRGLGDSGDDRWQVAIRGGRCSVVRDGDEEPTVTLTVGPVDFVKLITGNASGPMLFTFGKLKIRGDLLPPLNGA